MWHLTPIALECLSAEFPGETPSRVQAALDQAVWLTNIQRHAMSGQVPFNHRYALFWSPVGREAVIAVVEYEAMIVLRFFRAWDKQNDTLRPVIYEKMGATLIAAGRITAYRVALAIAASGTAALPATIGGHRPRMQHYLDFIRDQMNPSRPAPLSNGKFTLTAHAIERLSESFPKITPEHALSLLDTSVLLHKSFHAFSGNRVPVGNDYLLFWDVGQDAGVVAITNQQTRTVITFLSAWNGTEDTGVGAVLFEEVDGVQKKTGQVSLRDLQRAKVAAGIPHDSSIPSAYDLSIRILTSTGFKTVRAGAITCSENELSAQMKEQISSATDIAMSKGALGAVYMAKRRGQVTPAHEITLIEEPTQSGWLAHVSST